MSSSSVEKKSKNKKNKKNSSDSADKCVPAKWSAALVLERSAISCSSRSWITLRFYITSMLER